MLLKYYFVKTEDEMTSKIFTPGTIYLVEETKCLYIDPINGNSRIMLGGGGGNEEVVDTVSITIVNTELELSTIQNPIPNKLYLVTETSNIYVYYNDNWIKGTSGYTPIRGIDYWTDEDKAEIRSYVDDAILGGLW